MYKAVTQQRINFTSYEMVNGVPRVSTPVVMLVEQSDGHERSIGEFSEDATFGEIEAIVNALNARRAWQNRHKHEMPSLNCET